MKTKYNDLPSVEIVNTTKKALIEKGYEVEIVKNAQEALKEIIKSIPEGATVMNGSSTTLQQIGFIDFLKSNNHKWNNLHEKVIEEKDSKKQAELRKLSVISEYYLGSVHALTKTGDFIIASNTGSQLPHVVYTSQNLIFTVSTKKIVEDINEGLSRLDDHVVPLEDERMKGLYGVPTTVNKVLLFKGESKMLGRKIKFILITKDFGF